MSNIILTAPKVRHSMVPMTDAATMHRQSLLQAARDAEARAVRSPGNEAIAALAAQLWARYADAMLDGGAL